MIIIKFIQIVGGCRMHLYLYIYMCVYIYVCVCLYVQYMPLYPGYRNLFGGLNAHVWRNTNMCLIRLYKYVSDQYFCLPSCKLT